MGEQKARGDEEELIKTFHQAIKVVTFLALPCAIFFAVESKDIVAILLQNGKFSPEDTVICANLITIISVMIVPLSINLIMNNMFMVYKETKKLAISGSLMAIFSIPFYYLLSDKFGIYGIAIAYSIVYTIASPVNLILLKLRIPKIIDLSILSVSLKFIISGACMFGVIKATSLLLNTDLKYLNITVLLVAGALSYLAVSKVMGINGINFILSRFLPKGD
jgi:peptidoglycan biosynthesis protein MviN/MurJ (putative lipid II flippase)